MEEKQAEAQILSDGQGDDSNDCVSSTETPSNMPQPAQTEDHIEEECDDFGPRNQSIYTPSSQHQAAKTAKQIKIDERNKLMLNWCLYDGFNIILIKMTDALIKCGANPKIKHCVHQLWAAYLARIKVAYYEHPAAACPVNKEQEEEEAIINEEQSILPNWFSQATNKGSQEENDENDEPKDFLFAPRKVAVSCGSYSKKEDHLVDTPDEELSMSEKRSKRRKIRNSYLKLALSGADINKERAESVKEAEDKAKRKIRVYQLPRLYTLKDTVPEYFADGELTIELVRTKKSEDYIAPRSTCKDPEYLTLHKLLSFLHGALLMKGELISYGDLTRWVREAHIPLYAAHLLLPPTMPLTSQDHSILGCTSSIRSDGAPTSRIFRENTAKILKLLKISLVPKPPAFLWASKIIRDLQLPDELNLFVRHFNKLVSAKNDDEWKLSSFGIDIDGQSIYAASLVLISLKFVFGLDGTTEYKISDFAEKYNELLKLKPSSGFSRRQASAENGNCDNGSHQPSDTKPLFVWREWVRFIEFRRIAIERTHVPTAIRKDLLDKIDPEYVLRFAENEGFLLCNSKSTDEERPEKEKVLFSFIEKLSDTYPKPFTPTKRIPIFRPSLLGSQGLAEQLIEFDESKYGLLKQDFSSSSLVFARNPKVLASALKKANPPHSLKLQKGPAYKKVRLTTPFMNSRCGISVNIKSERTIETNRYGCKIFELNPEIVPVSALSDEEGEEDDDNCTQPEPNLLLFQPAADYWIASAMARLMAINEWNLFSAGFPPTFLWMLKLISESIEETPRDFYVAFQCVESIIMFRHTELKHTLSEGKQIKSRLVAAMRSKFD